MLRLNIVFFYQIRDKNRAKLKISYSCGHRVSKSARYDATFITESFEKVISIMSIFEPPHGKTNNLHMRKQRRRSASR